MPQHKSAVKRVRQNEKRRQRNQGQLSKMKTLVTKALETTDKEEAEEAFKEASSYLDKMAAKDLVHENFAARRKSKIAKHVNNL
ncbi:30S ribosomal protein S20 [Fodinibius halophilus]|uniref:Small ribosomal subunit protein bS20 n=1 Tax=Fodinibius halophilus TaxID=1736908 RepID=A0A6M1TC08_9BACT|nr:30S ribosomal protein S20 [Fodinibius halophilus]NGP87772.1 30S ribosomal protein S20 [Fodinibius halophilus]